ncbi:MAG: DUF6285 domain-containing protein [Actinomycetota bacterium]
MATSGMHDSPPSDELLDAVARTLTDQVLPETSGGTAHAVRVAANLCRIIAREIADDGEAEIAASLAEILGVDETVDLATALDEALLADDPDVDAAVADLLYRDVQRRVDIAKPGYRGIE